MKNNPIGIVGLGDLGTRIAAQEIHSGKKVVVFDKSDADYRPKLAVDPQVDITDDDESVTHNALQKIVSECAIVHWAVASSELPAMPTVPASCTVILHDSVMANSLKAIQGRPDKDRFVIAHCLMNDHGRVLVCTEFGNSDLVNRHLKEIGLAPRPTTIQEHDRMIARSQGIFALLIELGLRDELDHGFEAGNLTPSALELRAAVINRESNWTQQTIDSILANRQLMPLVREMLRLLHRPDDNSSDHSLL